MRVTVEGFDGSERPAYSSGSNTDAHDVRRCKREERDGQRDNVRLLDLGCDAVPDAPRRAVPLREARRVVADAARAAREDLAAAVLPLELRGRACAKGFA